MAAPSAAPIDIAPPRFSSSSPQNKTSNLTFAIREANANRELNATPNNQPSAAPSNDTSSQRPSISVTSRHDSINGPSGSFYGTSTRPISMKDRPRRESNAMGSFVGGLSWGGVSVGSWIRDDVMMSGTSPAFNNSPSCHSSSYLPKMEAAFMKDFTCCGLTLDSLHDLLQHFEETHANAPIPRTSQSAQGGLPQASSAGITAAPTQAQGEPALHTQHGFHPRSGSIGGGGGGRSQRLGSDGFSRTNLSTVQDMDTMDGDMDMDDINGTFDNLATIDEASMQFPVQPSLFSQNQSQLQPLNINLANTMHAHNGLRTSTPTTPAASQQFGLQNNPTVSSVNTPTLGTASMHNIQSRSSPESSHPGTPAELDMDFGTGFNNIGLQGMQGVDMNFGSMNFGNGMPGFDGTIDQPGKRLYSKQGAGGITQQQLQMQAYKNLGLSSNNVEMLRKFQEQQLAAGGMAQIPFPPEEVKPFRCPVIGCEKAYKNQNGLKYHKQHGHQNQQLKENEDGTFSIVDPLTSIPYPGTIGMEKEKPYRCEVCGKRYKNLNGLKYHRSHAPHCNPELKLQQLAALNSNLQGGNVNVAGAGMPGMDNNGSMF